MTAKQEDLASIVARIFEEAWAPSHHRGVVDPAEAHRGATRGDEDSAWIDEIVPFLRRALAVTPVVSSEATQEPGLRGLRVDLPLPLCVLTRERRPLLCTTRAEALLAGRSMLRLEGGVVRAEGAARQRAFEGAVAEAFEGGRSHTLCWPDAQGPSQHFLLSPMPLDSGESGVLLMLNLEVGASDRLSEMLVRAHGLTPSEAEVVARLAEGLSIDEIALAKGCSANTVRTQVKQAFAKTGTSRQGELIAQVLGGPAALLRLVDAEPAPRVEVPAGPGKPAVMGEHGLLDLDDGRILSFTDAGPESGRPVLLCHHLLGSRHEGPLDLALLDRLDVRLVVPERPGIGRSTPVEKRSLLAWADDARQLADALGLERFHVLGFSSGGPHAAACASQLPDRVAGLGMAASLMPGDELPTDAPLGLTHRFLMGMARRWPAGLRTLLARHYRLQLREPERSLAEVVQSGNAADAAVFRGTAVAARRLRDLDTARRAPPEVFADELVMLFRPWGFRLADVRAPIRLWHGRQDDFFSFDQAEAMAGRLSRAHAVFEEEWGHFFFYREWERLLRELLD